MKILQVIHDFLPRHTAGAEIYTYKLSKELAKRHEVYLYFTEFDHKLPFYVVKKGDYDGLPYFEVNKGHTYNSFRDTYNDSNMDAIFTQVLNEVKPDVVHIQHLLNHSLNYIRIAKDQDLPVIFTLHEYWLTCPRGGQRIRADLRVCHDIKLENCAECMLKESKNVSRPKRLASGFLKRALTSPADLIRATIQLVTEPGPSNKIDNRTVGWGEIQIIQDGHTEVPDSSLAGRVYSRLNDMISCLENKKMMSEVERRTSYVQEACSYVDLFIAPSRFLKQRFIEFGIPEDRIIYSDYGFDVRNFEFPKKNSEKVSFGYIGTLISHKGIHVLVEAFNHVSSAKAELKIYGDLTWFPDYIAELKRLKRNPNIHFMGRFDNQKVARIFSEIDVLVVPSIWFENSPLTIHEAFLSRTPIITSNFGGMAELVSDGVNGLLFEIGNASDLTDKLNRIINENGLLEELKQGIPPVKTIEEDAREIEKWYQNLSSC